MGDEINDTAPLKIANCSISVDHAVDITKQCAEKSLEVLDGAFFQGR